MTEEEMNALTDQINNYWQNRPKSGSGEEKKKLVPIYEFDNLEFTSQEHIDAVRALYESRGVPADHNEGDA